jgi:hypothetical protein
MVAVIHGQYLGPQFVTLVVGSKAAPPDTVIVNTIITRSCQSLRMMFVFGGRSISHLRNAREPPADSHKQSHTMTASAMNIDRNWLATECRKLGIEDPIGTVPKTSDSTAQKTVSLNHLSFLCEFCANLSEKPVQSSFEQFTKHRTDANKSIPVSRLEKSLDHGIGVRIPASQPTSLTFPSSLG